MAKNKKIFENALKFHQAGQLDLAAPLYYKFLKNNPVHEQALYLLGTLYSQQGKSVDALPRLKKVLDLNPKHVDALNSYGLVLSDIGEFDKAVLQFEKVLKINPEHINAITNLGMVLLKIDKASAAVEYLERAITLNQQHIQAHSNLGHAYYQLNNWDAAEVCYKKILQLNPNMVVTHYHLGRVNQKKEKFEKALQCYQNALMHNENFPEAHNELANVLGILGQKEKAYEHYHRAIYLNPKLEKAYIDFGNIALTHHEYRQAADAYDNAIALNSKLDQIRYKLAACLKYSGDLQAALNHSIQLTKESENVVNAHCLTGEIYFALKDYDSAIQYYQQAIILDAKSTRAHNGIGAAFIGRGQGRDFEVATHHFQEVLELEPKNWETLNNLGYLCRIRGFCDESIKHFEQAILVKQDYGDAHMNLALALLSKGELNKGWQEYEWRWKTSNQKPRPFKYPEWQGEKLTNKTILVYGEQGVGDEILFASCIPDIIKTATLCIIECDARLAPIFARSFPLAIVVARTGYNDVACLDNTPKIDFQVAICSLSKYYRSAMQEFPKNNVGYLKANPDRVNHWEEKLKLLGPGLKVGFSWRSSLSKGISRVLIHSLDYWKLLLLVPNVHFINLQYDDCGIELEQIYNRWGVRVIEFPEIDKFNDLDELANIISALDLVISIGNAVASMAGALGKEVWRTTSAGNKESLRLNVDEYCWFPNMKLFYSSNYEPEELGYALYRKANEKLKPNVILNMGKCKNTSNIKESENSYELATKYKRCLEYKKAIDVIIKAIKSDSCSTSLYNVLGDINRRCERFDEAKENYKKVLEKDKQCIEAYCGLSMLYLEEESEGSLGESKKHLFQAISLNHEYFMLLPILDRLSKKYLALGVLKEFSEISSEMLKINSYFGEARLNLAYIYLSKGQLQAAWEEFEWRQKQTKFTYPEWNGKLSQKCNILIYREGNSSDDIFFASCVSELENHFKTTVLLCSEKMLSLFRRSFPKLTVCTEHDIIHESNKVVKNNINYQLGIKSLPKYFRKTLEEFPNRQSYLVPDKNRSNFWKRQLEAISTDIKVGVFWTNSVINERKLEQKYIYFRLLQELFSISNIHIVLLQKDIEGNQIDCVVPNCKSKITNFSDQIHFDESSSELSLDNIKNLDEFAAILSALDLVISLPNSINVLSGALGIPTWILCAGDKNFRPFCFGRDDNIWLPRISYFTATDMYNISIKSKLAHFIGQRIKSDSIS